MGRQLDLQDSVDAAQARLILTTGITQAYFGLERLYRQRDLAVAAQENWKAARLLIDRRLAQGLENRAALRQADADFSRSVEEVAAIDEDIALRRNQLAALIGAGPDRGTAIERPIRATILTGGVPDGVSTDLIGRRPDIVASRERVEAALAARPDVPQVSVAFDAMNRDWRGEMSRVYRLLGLELDTALEARMEAYLARASRGLERHRYSVEEFGLSVGEVRAALA